MNNDLWCEISENPGADLSISQVCAKKVDIGSQQPVNPRRLECHRVVVEEVIDTEYLVALSGKPHSHV
jgi:hypothetical protein